MLRAERHNRLAAIGRLVYNRYRLAAMRAVRSAIREGRLTHPSLLTCADCGVPAEAYDHRHYDQPLAVSPICFACNLKRGMGVIDPDRIDRDLSPYWGSGDVEEYAKVLGFDLEPEDPPTA